MPSAQGPITSTPDPSALAPALRLLPRPVPFRALIPGHEGPAGGRATITRVTPAKAAPLVSLMTVPLTPAGGACRGIRPGESLGGRPRASREFAKVQARVPEAAQNCGRAPPARPVAGHAPVRRVPARMGALSRCVHPPVVRPVPWPAPVRGASPCSSAAFLSYVGCQQKGSCRASWNGGHIFVKRAPEYWA